MRKNYECIAIFRIRETCLNRLFGLQLTDVPFLIGAFCYTQWFKVKGVLIGHVFENEKIQGSQCVVLNMVLTA